MGIDVNFDQQTPSDFAHFVYCGAKWAMEKNSLLDLNRKPEKFVFKTKRSAEKYRDKLLGQKNEHKCLEYVLSETSTSPSQIIFSGIGQKNYRLLTSKIESLGIDIQCRPDLIVRKINTNLLYEFKAVSELGYLFDTEFDSYHAQVWCYTALQEFNIDEFYLVRYFVDPFIYPFTQIKKLETKELNPSKFEKLFKIYNDAIQELKEIDEQIKKGNQPHKLNLYSFNRPKEEKEKLLKCSHCRYNGHVCKADLY